MVTICIARIIIDVSLYFAVFAFLLSVIGPGLTVNIGLTFSIVCIIGAVSCIMSKLSRWVRFIPLVFIAFCLKNASTISDYLLIAPLTIYLALQIWRNQWLVSYTTVYNNFRYFIGLYCFIAVFALITGSGKYLETASIPYITIWLFLSVYIMRLLRLSEENLLSAKYRAINAAAGAAVMLAALIISSPAVQRTLSTILSLVYKYIVSPLVIAFGYLVLGFFWCISQVFYFINITAGKDVEMPQSNINLEGFNKTLGDVEIGEPIDLTGLLIAIGVIAAAIIAVSILKRMLHSDEAKAVRVSAISREPIITEKTAGNRLRQIFHRNSSRDKVRNYYKRYLHMCEKINIPVDGSLSSADICCKSEEFMCSDAVENLRTSWLPARYSDNASITEDDVRTARDAFKNLNFQP